MQVTIVSKSKKKRRGKSNGTACRHIEHGNQTFVEVPESGEYQIQLYNDSHRRRMAVVSVDGINVINGDEADHDGPSYVLRPWETLVIPGWRRDDGSVAAFQFEEQEESYAARTGHGTTNVGVVGVAVFDEKPKVTVTPPPIKIEEHHHHHHYPPVQVQPRPWDPFRPTIIWSGSSDLLGSSFSLTSTDGGTDNDAAPQGVVSCNMVDSLGGERNARARISPQKAAKDVGTGYGRKVDFHTTSVEFEPEDTPVQVIELRYATRERLRSWGVPVDKVPSPKGPSAFPRARGLSVPPPPAR